MSDPQGDPTFRTIPLDSLQSDWRITHNYYDHTDAEQDFNLIFPLEHLRELQRSGEIGALTSRHFSLMGHIEEVHVPTLLHQTSRKLANLLREEYADIALLVPA
jgi:D-proline reductase (dithiol) PrdB